MLISNWNLFHFLVAFCRFPCEKNLYLLVATVGTDIDTDSHLPKNISSLKNHLISIWKKRMFFDNNLEWWVLKKLWPRKIWFKTEEPLTRLSARRRDNGIEQTMLEIGRVEKTPEFSVGHETLELSGTQRTPWMVGRMQDTNTGDTQGTRRGGGLWQNSAFSSEHFAVVPFPEKCHSTASLTLHTLRAHWGYLMTKHWFLPVKCSFPEGPLDFYENIFQNNEILSG